MNAKKSIQEVLSTIRIKQWAKNVFTLIPAPFLLHEGMLNEVAVLAFFCAGFCIAASSAYLINDTMDRQRDRLHPRKRYRAIASGRLSVRAAIIAAILFTIFSLEIGFVISIQAGILLAGYLILSHIYTFQLKHHSLVDVVIVGVLFSIRTFGGFLAVSYYPPGWELWVLLAGLIAFIVELGKRKCEVQALGNSSTTRRTLSFYSNKRLTQMFSVGLVLVILIYVPASISIAPLFVFSGVLVLPGIWRYWHLISTQIEDVHPQRVIFADIQMRFILIGFTAFFTLSTTLLAKN